MTQFILFYIWPVLLTGGAIGDCAVDSFVINSPGNKGSPEICGLNTGQHSKYTFLKVMDYYTEKVQLIHFKSTFIDCRSPHTSCLVR